MPQFIQSARFQVCALIALFCVLSFAQYNASPAPDFYASWRAGQAWVDGDFGSIYPQNTGIFDLLAPPTWYAQARETGYTHDLFPFIYPPIWAVLTGALSKITSFGVLTAIAAAVNPIMLSVCVILAGRIVGLKQITPALLLGGQIVLFATWIGQLALIQNQPQIFVAFLTLLSIERAQADKPVTAGAALALAASIKLYPALFIIFLLAAGHRRVALPFVLFGAALGGASVALAGWPLHAVFLAQIKTIAQTVLVTPVSFSFDPLIGQTLFGDHLLDVPRPDWAVNNNPNDHAYLSYVMMAKPALWKTLNGIAVFLCIAGGALALFLARRRPKSGLNSGWIWAACMGLYALLSPLSWSYHYIAIAAFAPYVVLWIGARYGVLLLLALFVPLAFPAPVLYSNLKFAIFPFQIIGTVSLALYVCTLLRLTYSHKSPPSTTVSKP